MSTPLRRIRTRSVPLSAAEMVPWISGVSSLVVPPAEISPEIGSTLSSARVITTVCVGALVSTLMT
ncbi:MAG: hypothetical protein ACK5PF_10325 [bacterium]